MLVYVGSFREMTDCIRRWTLDRRRKTEDERQLGNYKLEILN